MNIIRVGLTRRVGGASRGQTMVVRSQFKESTIQPVDARHAQTCSRQVNRMWMSVKKRYPAEGPSRGDGAGRSAERACERSSDWPRGAQRPCPGVRQ
jgi:hypothetical protein